MKRFSQDKKSICLYNFKIEKKITGASLRNQCYRDYFYGKKQILEKTLGEIEAGVNHIFNIIDETKTLPPSNNPIYIFLIIFIVIQHGRTKYAVEALNEMTDKSAKLLLSPMAKRDGIDLDKVKIGLKNAAQRSVALNTQMYPMLLDLRCKLLINCTNVEFVTSDNPVVFYNKLMDFRKHGSNTGYANKGLQIFFPIDPNSLILLYDRDVYRVGNDKEDVIEIKDVRDIYEINTLQICSCLENIYFLDQRLNCNALHKKAKPFLRKTKATVKKFPEYESKFRKSEIVMMFQEDIRTNLNLSFLTIRKSAKEWINKIRSQRLEPTAIVRNEQLCKDYEEFNKAVEKKKYKPSDFFNFFDDKYDRS